MTRLILINGIYMNFDYNPFYEKESKDTYIHQRFWTHR